MLNVKDDELVIEHKGIYSVEKFLVARRLMYWQVYLHKTSLVAEQLVIRVLKRAISTEHYSEKIVRSVTGGVLIQDEDRNFSSDIECVTLNKDLDLELVSFGAIVTKHFRSNAISLVEKKNGQFTLIGAGMGNPNRLVSTTQAIAKAKENGISHFDDTVLVSDAFFPFRDNVDLASSHGIKTIVQPGGSIKDKEVVSACDENSMVMAFTGIRHFRH